MMRLLAIRSCKTNRLREKIAVEELAHNIYLLGFFISASLADIALTVKKEIAKFKVADFAI